MSLDITKVRLILREHLLSAVPGLPILQQWENRAFETPEPESTNWIRELIEPISERVVASNTLSNTGNYRVDVVVPSGEGTSGLEAITDAIVAAYNPGLNLSGGVPLCTVQITRSQRRLARRDPTAKAWYAQPVVVSWLVYTVNNL